MKDTTRDALFLALLCGALLLPGAAFRGPTGLEFRTGIFVRGMLQSGPALIPRLEGTPYYDYPPLYFLAAAATAAVTGSIAPLALALPSVIAAMGTVFLTCVVAARAGRLLGRTAGLALAVTPLFMEWSSQASVDALLVFFISLAVFGWWRRLSSGARRHAVLACAGVAGAVLTKGPIGAAIPLAAVATYHVARREWRPLAAVVALWGLLLLLLAALGGAAIALREGPEALRRILDAQLLNRVTDEPNAPLGLYAGVFFAGFAPWSVFAFIQLFRRAPEAPVERHSLLVLCAAWLLSTAALLTAATIKHTRYLLPAAPPTAVLCAAFWTGELGPRAGRYFGRAAAWIRRACAIAVAAALPFSLLAPLRLRAASALLAWAVPVSCALAFADIRRRTADEARAAFRALAWTLGIGFLVFCQFALPVTGAKEEARPFVEAVEKAAGGGPILFYDLERDQEGLKFLYWRKGRNDLTFVPGEDDLAAALPLHGGGLLVVPAGRRESVEGRHGGEMSFLLEGRLGKRRCAVFRIDGGV
ncbi:MAG: glycosyltransferase family 39 protein [bacterium]|nr:glycosyltransferase family 39 protein [bacterium]